MKLRMNENFLEWIWVDQNASEYFIISEERSFFTGFYFIYFLYLFIYLSLHVLMVLMDFDSPLRSIKIGLAFITIESCFWLWSIATNPFSPNFRLFGSLARAQVQKIKFENSKFSDLDLVKYGEQKFEVEIGKKNFWLVPIWSVLNKKRLLKNSKLQFILHKYTCIPFKIWNKVCISRKF